MRVFSVPDIAVCGHVSVQIGDVPECFVADSALVRSGRAVSGLVLLKVCLLPESLLAHLALEWTFTCGGANSLLSRSIVLHHWVLLSSSIQRTS